MPVTHAMRRYTTVGTTPRAPLLRDGDRAHWAGCTCGWQQASALVGDDLELVWSNLIAQWEGHTAARLAMYPADTVQRFEDTDVADLTPYQVCAQCQAVDETCPDGQRLTRLLCCQCEHEGTEH